MTAVVSALGAVVGYLGPEVAEESLFERILWPQRFFNYVDLPTLLKTSILMPMGGPFIEPRWKSWTNVETMAFI